MTVQRHHHLGDLDKRDVITALAQLTDQDEIVWKVDRIWSMSGWTTTHEGSELGVSHDLSWEFYVKEVGRWRRVYKRGARQLGRAIRRQHQRLALPDVPHEIVQALAPAIKIGEEMRTRQDVVAYLVEKTLAGQLVWESGLFADLDGIRLSLGARTLQVRKNDRSTDYLGIAGPLYTRQLIKAARASVVEPVRELTPVEQTLMTIVQKRTR